MQRNESPIQKALALAPTDLGAIFEVLGAYQQKYDLEEVVALVTDEGLNKSIRHAAYIYLIVHADLDTLKNLAAHIDFAIKYAYIADAVLRAVVSGRQDVLAWLIQEKNLSLDVRDYYGAGPVYTAIKHGQVEMLQTLLKPVKEGGYGLSLDVHIDGAGPVMCAVWHGQVEMLKVLLKPKAEGGYGLSLNVQNNHGMGPVLYAVWKGQFAMLEKLLKPVAEGGYGLPLGDVSNLLHVASYQKYINIFLLIFMQHVNELGMNQGGGAAFAWAQAAMNKYNFATDELKKLLVQRYKEILEQNLKVALESDAENVRDAIEALSPDEGFMKLVHIYAESRDFCSVWENYLTVFKSADALQKLKEEAACELAGLILSGNVVMDENGNLDKKVTESRGNAKLTPENEKIRAEEGKDLAIMQQRAIFAYGYLHKLTSVSANRLREKLNNILCGDLSQTAETQASVWAPSVTKKYLQYYAKKNRLLLNEEAYEASVLKSLDADEAEKEKKPNLAKLFSGTASKAAGAATPSIEFTSKRFG